MKIFRHTKTNLSHSIFLSIVLAVSIIFPVLQTTQVAKADIGNFCSVHPENAYTAATLTVTDYTKNTSVTAFGTGVQGENKSIDVNFGDSLNFSFDGEAGPGDAEGTVQSTVVINGTTLFNQTVTGGVGGTAVGVYSYDISSIAMSGVASIGAVSCSNNLNVSVTINTTVGATPSFDFSCGVTQSVVKGTSANFPLSATNLVNFSSSISTTMSSSPSGPTLTGSPMTLSSANSYAAVGVVPTSSLTAGQSYTLTFTAIGGGVTKTCNSLLTVQALTPTVDIKFDNKDGPTTPTPPSGTSGTLTWTTQNATSCTAFVDAGVYAPWTGSQDPLNPTPFSVTGLLNNTTYEFDITCQNGVGGPEATDWVIVTVGAQLPTATFQCQGDLDQTPLDDNCSVSYGANAVLTFTSSYTNSCSLDPAIPGYDTPINETEGVLTGALYNPPSNVTYTLTCVGDGGSIVKQLNINVASSDLSVDLKCTSTDGKSTDGPCSVGSGQLTKLTWTSSSCDSLSIDQGIGSVDYNNITDGLQIPITQTTTFEIACSPPVELQTICAWPSVCPGDRGGGPSILGDTLNCDTYPCTDSNGVVYDAVTVNVDPGARSIDLKCTGPDYGEGDTPSDGPCHVFAGDTVHLSWTAVDCGTTTIDNGVGEVDPNSTKGVDQVVNQGTTFIISCDAPDNNGYVASDSVNVTVPFADCAPSPLVITKGGAPGIITTTIDEANLPLGYNLNIVPSFDNSPTPTTPPTFSYTNNPQASGNHVTAVIVSSSNSTSAGQFILTITAQSELTKGSSPPPASVPSSIASCTITLIINGDTPEPPDNVQANADGVCGSINVTWQRPATGVVPDHYEVYRYFNPTQGMGQKADYIRVGPDIIDSGLSDGNFSFTDADPLYPSSSNLYAVKSVLGSLESSLAESNSVIPTSCGPSLDLSDLDLARVGNTIGSPTSCNNQSDTLTLPNQGIFKSGSRVYFNINVCNSGTVTLTGLVVTNVGYSGLTDIQREPPLITKGHGDCVADGSGEGPYTLNDLNPKAVSSDPIPVCTITLSATLTPPKDSSGYLYRFWNQAVITSNELDPKVVSTPPYLFSNGGSDSIPTRGEFSP